MSNHKAQSETDTDIPANLRDVRTSFWEPLRRWTESRFRMTGPAAPQAVSMGLNQENCL